MKKIVTFGEIMLRFSTEIGERLFQTQNLAMHYGGAEANVAVSLSRFGQQVNFVSKIPENPLGKAVERHLHSHGVHTDYLIKGGERLGTYYVETGVGARSAQVTYDRKYSSFSSLTLEELNVDEILDGAELFHVTGITPALSDKLKELTYAALRRAKELGVKTSFDFNYRGKLWSQKEAGETIIPFLPFVDICSFGELDALFILEMENAPDSFEKDGKLQFYYEKLQDMYPNIKYISSTFRNVISASTNTLQGNFYMNGKLYQSKLHHIDHIVDRIGGGDAFAAGILHGILEKMPPEQIVSFATAASAMKHTVCGDCNIFTEDEIMAFAQNEPSKIVR